MQITHIMTYCSLCTMTYRRMLYILAFIKLINLLQNVYTCLVSWEKHTPMITLNYHIHTVKAFAWVACGNGDIIDYDISE